MALIQHKRRLNPTVTLMEVSAPLIAKKAQPGQFIILRVDEHGERIPLTISDYDRERGAVTIIFQKVGLTTELLDRLEEGDDILDFVGPLGTPTDLLDREHPGLELGPVKRVAVIGGGVGCAIAYPQAKYLHARGVEVDVIAGFRSKDIVILEEEFKKSLRPLLSHHRRRLLRGKGAGHRQAQNAHRLRHPLRRRHRYWAYHHDEVRL